LADETVNRLFLRLVNWLRLNHAVHDGDGVVYSGLESRARLS
jgi:hypothetical protein